MTSTSFFQGNTIPDAPHLHTKKALLLIDFQNDFTSPDGALFVPNTKDFLPKIPDLLAKFRDQGQVIWTRTEFTEPRPTISPSSGSYVIVLEEFIRDSSSDQEHTPQDEPSSQEGEIVDADAYLAASLAFGVSRCCLPGNTGSAFSDQLIGDIDLQRDFIFAKSEYSAFAGTTLLSKLRTTMVTHLYICGSMSNASVYASTLDAVRHGMTVTIIEDCLGYRSDRCHLEAMRQMADNMGADGVDYQELMDDLAGLLGDVVDEHTFQSKFEVITQQSKTIQGDPIQKQDVQEWISRLHQANIPQEDKTKLVSVEQAEGHTKDTHLTPRVSQSKPGASKSLSPPWKRSTDDLEFDDHSLHSLQTPLKRRASHDAYAGTPVTGEHNRRRSRRRKELPKAVTSPAVMTTKQIAETPEQRRKLSDIQGSQSHSDDPLLIEAPIIEKSAVVQTGLDEPANQVMDVTPDGDSRLFYDLVPRPSHFTIFASLKREVTWQKMYHRTGEVPRLVAVQGEATDAHSTMPLYRHPADESPPLLPFTMTVQSIRQYAEKIIKHPLNHVLIQLYRNGEDNISEHSDKTLDVVRGSKIVNYSAGAQRTMTLRMKKSAMFESSDSGNRQMLRIPLSHNSLFVLGQTTNKYWLHSIRADKRASWQKSAAELDYEGERISLTFRQIGTFIEPREKLIWGQGATSKTRETAQNILQGAAADEEGERLIRAFGLENHRSHDFSWDEWYGKGFDVINFTTKDHPAG